MARARGVTREQLAAAVSRPGLEGDAAARAVGNWLTGRDHPRCKPADIARLADALGCAPKDIAVFISRVRFHRGSPRKARLLVDLVRGRSVDQARTLLAFQTKRAAVNVKKALDAAVADALLSDADETRLVVSLCAVDDGPRIKRFQPKDRGRAHPILKRLAHITVGVAERTDGRKGP
jgi:large subunit ribosomal protein L22